MLHEYHDIEVTDWLQFGFSISRSDEVGDPILNSKIISVQPSFHMRSTNILAWKFRTVPQWVHLQFPHSWVEWGYPNCLPDQNGTWINNASSRTSVFQWDTQLMTVFPKIRTVAKIYHSHTPQLIR